MNQAESRANQDKVAYENNVDRATIASLIADFAKEDGVSPAKARESLVAIGRPAVPFLIEVLTDDNKWVRWEAAKALSQIADPAAAAAMAKALEDKVFGVRWLAAEGLIAMVHQGLPALLQALIDRSESVWLREGAHHVLHDLAREDLGNVLRPVLMAMEHHDPSVEVPLAAQAALKALKGM
ncbi:HEAT repeat domain-containing protein [Chloroflexota bacterium]